MKKSSPTDVAKMDSLKVPQKGGSTTTKPSTGSIPITVRFNAGEESIDDIFQNFHTGGGDSLSSSPHQNVEENPRNANFLQGNFFNNRRRSGSIEGSPSGSIGDSNSIGTWKLFKGRVSQAMEDIKSSKSNQPTTKSETNAAADMDSDVENATINSSISDELSLDQEIKMLTKQNGDSDSDIDPDILLNDDIETSTIRKSFANLRSKVSNKSAIINSGLPAPQSTIIQQDNNNETNTSLSNDINNRSASSSPKPTTSKDLSPVARASLSIRNSLLRNRKNNQNPIATIPSEIANNPTTTSNTTTSTTTTNRTKKKDIEIESGVEMKEDTNVNTSQSKLTNSNEKSIKAEPNQINPTKKKHLNCFKSSCCCSQDDSNLSIQNPNNKNDGSQVGVVKPSNTTGSPIRKFIINLLIAEFPYVTIIICIILLTVFDLPDFFRGVIACVMTFSIMNKAAIIFAKIMEHLGGPERTRFQIPNYSKMPILEIPHIEEYQISKNYSGWMNTIHHYDPDEFKMSSTHSMHIKLEGSVIVLSETNDRIPKRQMWNEKSIDLKTVSFTQIRKFNMLGCRVELRPRGLAKKRYFNRKYPIQLILKNPIEELKPPPAAQTPERKETSKNPSKQDIPTESNRSSKAAIKVVTEDKKDAKVVIVERSPSNSRVSVDSEAKQMRDFQSLMESSRINIDQRVGFNRKSIGNDLFLKQSLTSSFSDLMSLNSGNCNECLINGPGELLRAEIARARKDCANLEIYESDIPFSDETQIWLFARCDRQKEDWYRRFSNASQGLIKDHDVHLSNVVVVSDSMIEAAANSYKTDGMDKVNIQWEDDSDSKKEKEDKTESSDEFENIENYRDKEIPPGDKASEADEHINALDASLQDYGTDQLRKDLGFEGLIIADSAGRNPADYIKFMSIFQKACRQTKIPIVNTIDAQNDESLKKQLRNRRAEGDLWKGINQTLFLGPSGSIVWFNVLAGRFIYSCIHNPKVINSVQILIQKKISAIKLPNFLEDVIISNINIGEKPPLIHRVSQPMLDERGTWIDADVTYDGLVHMTVTAKMNLMRLKKSNEQQSTTANTPTTDEKLPEATAVSSIEILLDSDAESDGGSSEEEEIESDEQKDNVANKKGEGKAKRIFKFVDRIATSNLFQLATELPVVQKAMEKASTNITLRVDLKGLVGRAVVNIPPPPSDRVWIAFRAPPRLWLTAKPALGDLKVDWGIVTSIIENRLCSEVSKFLVYPNMTDITIPILGSPTYVEE